jgi:hypothetical protein
VSQSLVRRVCGCECLDLVVICDYIVVLISFIMQLQSVSILKLSFESFPFSANNFQIASR